ncbi:hypothetical protein vBSsoS008_021 [Shigella phage vB_SsoS_008]|nr:hypothetical protein vBSsoS008_021 [Shigella phage vB_SsoS_008]
MITINDSEKPAREMADAIGDQLHVKGLDAELLNQIEKQLTDRSTNCSGVAAWKSERILPNIFKAWKRKHKKEINVDDLLIYELTPSKVAQYQLRYMESFCNSLLNPCFSFKGGK